MHVETNLETEKPPTFADAAQASAEVDASRIEFMRDEVRVLSVPMTEEERLAKGDELVAQLKAVAKLDADLEVEAGQFKATKARLTAERESQLAQAKFLANAIESRAVDHDVPCRVEKVFATGVVRTVRIDTGETVDEVAMEADERQADLFAARTDAPESFSDLHEDSDVPMPIMVEGEVLALTPGADDCHFLFQLRNFDTQVRCVAPDEMIGTDLVDVGDALELVGHYGGEEGAEIATFIATELRVIDPETEIDATKMATVGEHVEHKTNGKGRKGR